VIFFFRGFLPLAFTDPSVNRKAAVLVLVCPGYFISPVPSISGEHIVQRMPDTRTVKKVFNWKPLTKRLQGRPKYRWEDNIKQDICQLKIQNCIAFVQNRGNWEEVVEKAKTFN